MGKPSFAKKIKVTFKALNMTLKMTRATLIKVSLSCAKEKTNKNIFKKIRNAKLFPTLVFVLGPNKSSKKKNKNLFLGLKYSNKDKERV